MNSTRPTFLFPTPNVVDAAQPIFNKLTSCLVRIQLAAEGLPALGGTFFGGLFGKDKPDPYVEIFHLLPTGEWDRSSTQHCAVSSAGRSGGCLYRTEPCFQTTRPKYMPIIVGLHALCYGDVNRLIRLRFRHKNVTLGWVELTLKEMYLAMNKKVPLRPGGSNEWRQDGRSRPATAQSTMTTSGTDSILPDPTKSVGSLLIKKVSIFSHLSDLPKLCANAGILRQPVAGVSDLPVQELIRLQGESETIVEANGEDMNDPHMKQSLASGNNIFETTRGKLSSAASTPTTTTTLGPPIPSSSSSSSTALSLPSSTLRPNIYRGLHHLRSKAAGKFFQSFLPVKASLNQDRQLAILMGNHARLGAQSVIRKHFLQSEIFDPQLIPLIFTYTGTS